LLLIAATLALPGCGGAGTARVQTLSGDGYSFEAPGDWKARRTPQSIEATLGDNTVSVTVFRLTHPYRPELWPEVVPELDGVARNLADQLRGQAGAGSTVTVAGRRARRYAIAFRRRGGDFVERITFVLAGRREYQLLCRYRVGADVRPCAALGSSFRLR
jgi:plasmid stabilization system protein ParE